MVFLQYCIFQHKKDNLKRIATISGICLILVFLVSLYFKTTVAIAAVCPSTSQPINGRCVCGDGYVWNKESTQCITYTQGCHDLYGLHAFAVKSLCYCSDGYVWNKNKTSCITYTDDCRLSFGDNVVGVKNSNGNNSLCNCISGYIWNDAKTECVSLLQVCQTKYGNHSINNNSKGTCDCAGGYVWNRTKTTCISRGQYIRENLKTFVLIGIIDICLMALLSCLIFLIAKNLHKKITIKEFIRFFLGGVIIAPLIFVLETFVINRSTILAKLPVLEFRFLVVLAGATIEELTKFTIAFILSKKISYPREPANIIIRWMIVALGFAMVENIITSMSLISGGGTVITILGTLIGRFTGANSIHLICAEIVGFSYALNLFRKNKSCLFIGITSAIILHTIFNFVVFTYGGLAVFKVGLPCFIILLFSPILLKHLIKHIK
jgi:RsiW-degrading membrane proteinase PrsW (M82 family)